MKSILRNTIKSWEQGFSQILLFITASVAKLTTPRQSTWRAKERRRNLSHSLTRKMAGIMHADIVGYARLTEQDEEGTYLRLVESMKIIATHINANSGRVANYAGDAILAEFRNATGALRCAIGVQDELKKWNANIPLEQQLQYRIGLNMGDVIMDRGDIYGNAVNLAARLEGLANTGGICVSENFRLNIENQFPAKFRSLGKQYLKNISKPVLAYMIEPGLPKLA